MRSHKVDMLQRNVEMKWDRILVCMMCDGLRLNLTNSAVAKGTTQYRIITWQCPGQTARLVETAQLTECVTYRGVTVYTSICGKREQEIASVKTHCWAYDSTVSRGLHRFRPAKFQNFSKPYAKPIPTLALTSLRKKKPKTPIASLQGRTCTVQCMPFDSRFKKSRTIPNPNSKFHTFPVPEIKFLKFQNSSKISKTSSNCV